MKLLDVLPICEAKLPPKYSSKSINGILPKNSVIGKGFQALVYDVKSNPNAVIKIIPIIGENDSAYQFLRLCVNNQNNPFFPKIYSYKFYKVKNLTIDDENFLDEIGYYALTDEDLNAKAIMFIVTEELFHTDPAIINAFEKLGIPTEDDLLDYQNYTIPIARKISYVIVNYFRTAKNRLKLRNNVHDVNFKNALRLLEPLFKNYMPDLHINNFMVRESGDLVINDPIVANTENINLNNLKILKPAIQNQKAQVLDNLTKDEQSLFNKYKGLIKSADDYRNLPQESKNEIKNVFKSEFRFLVMIK